MPHILGRVRHLEEMPIDQIYVIYGPPGTGKSVLASTFPKTEANPMLYADILEGGTGSISKTEAKNIHFVSIQTADELDQLLTAIDEGSYEEGGTRRQVPKYSTIVFDSATQLEFLLKQSIMADANKDRMSRDLWGLTRQGHDQIWNLCKYLHQKTGAIIVVIAQSRDIDKENNPSIDKVIPAMMPSAAFGLCAKASFVWYTNIEEEVVVNPETKKPEKFAVFVTYIDAHPLYLSKVRKPKGLEIPSGKVKNLTYPKFKKHVIDKLEAERNGQQ